MEQDTTGPQSDLPREHVTDLRLLLPPAQPRERADAARNRVALLDAAAYLFARDGVEATTIDAIAAEAGVGKGTVFRRFGDKSGLAAALLNTREATLQAGILSGEPPLGPGAPPAERLHAFVNAYLDYLLSHLDLIRVSETAAAGARYRIGSYRFWHRHVSILLDTHDDADALAHLLLAGLAAEHVKAVLPELGGARIRTSLHALAERLG